MRYVLDSLRTNRQDYLITRQRLDDLIVLEDSVTDPMLLGELYRCRGHYEQDYGNTALAHIYYQQALQYFQQVDNVTSAYWQTECLVAIATEFYSLKDTIGLNSVAQNLDEIVAKYNNHPISYQYNHAYYHLADCKYRYSGDRQQLQLFFQYLRKAIAATNQMTSQELIDYQINPAWDYFNLASGYDVYTNPKQLDSINKYVNLCEQAIPLSLIPSDSSNLVYHVENERVWVQYYQHKYDSVEYGFNRLLDMLANDNHLLYRDRILNQQQLYLFIKEYNCTIGNYRMAYKYQQMQYEEERKIFDVEKMKAISNIEIQFEAERKQQEIERLKQENIITTRNYTLVIISIITLLILLISGAIIYLVVQKNREQKLYEAALEAELQKENRNTNLKHTIQRMAVDFPKYEKMFEDIDIEHLQHLINQAETELTTMDIQYLIAFQELQLKPVQVAELFNVEPASVYTVRYRIRKKFPADIFD